MANPVMHFEVMVNGDVDAVRRFYAEAFGWKIDADNPMNYGLVEGVGRGIGGGIGKPLEGPSYATFYIAVDDVQQALSKIESLGGQTVMPAMDVPGQNITIANFRDPAGIVIGLVKPHTAQPAREDLELVISRVIDAPRAVVFATWTDAKRLTEWWGPHGMTTPVCEMELRPGGIFHTVMRDASGTEYPNQGVFLEVTAPERVVFTDAYEPGWKPSAEPFLTAIITFEELPGGKTRITGRALHRSFADRIRHEHMGFAKGWGEMLERFAACVARNR